MQLHFTGHDIEVSDALRQLIESKFKKITRHFNHTISRADVILGVQKLVNSAEITVHITGAQIHAHAKENDMYKAIDQMIAKLDKQLIKYKEKMSDHHRG